MHRKCTGREYRKQRIRKKIAGTADRPRLSVFRSLKHIGAQIIDDDQAKTLVAVSTTEANFRGKANGNCTAAKAIGELLAERAKAKGVTKVVFDRNGSRYHGRVKALADGAREKGLQF